MLNSAQIANETLVRMATGYEQVIAIGSNHRNLCDLDARSVPFGQIRAFVETAIEDAGAAIARETQEGMSDESFELLLKIIKLIWQMSSLKLSRP